MPSDKRARQRAAREARLAAEAQSQKRRKQIRNGIIIVVIAAVIVGIVFLVSGNDNNKNVASDSKVTTTTAAAAKGSNAQLQAQANEAAVKAGCPASPKTPTAAASQKYTAAPPMTIDTSKTYTATFKTTTGTFVASLDTTAAPKTVNNFVFLANKGYFNCGSFFRVIPGFVLQTGNPTQTNGGTEPGYTIPDELPAKAANPAQQYPLGSLVMANTGRPTPAAASSSSSRGPKARRCPTPTPSSARSRPAWMSSARSTSRARPAASRPT